MLGTVSALSPRMLDLIARKLQRTFHGQIAHPPVADFRAAHPLVVRAILHVYSDLFGLSLAHQHCIAIAAAHSDKGTHCGKHPPKGLWMLPGEREGADSPSARAARSPIVRVTGQSNGQAVGALVTLHLPEHFLNHESVEIVIEPIEF